MIAAAKTKFPKGKISRAVGEILPKGQTFALHIAESEIGRKKIVRVVTPAWKKLRGWERIGKVLAAVNGKLTPREQKHILRFSVLTPEEYRRIVLGNAASSGRTVKASAPKKLAAQRKRAPKK